MKKIILLAIASSGLAMVSCNKNYNCYCKQILNNRDTVHVYIQKERSSNKAQKACENMSDTDGQCSLTQ